MDSIAYSNDLTLHFGQVTPKESKFAKETLVSLRESAKKFNKNIKFNKKQDPGSFYEWEHLRYSEKSFFSGTLTSHKADTFSNAFEKNSVFDTELNFDRVAYEENIKIISEFLSKLIFPNISTEGNFIGGDDNLVDLNMQQQLIKFLSHNPRIPTQLTGESKVAQELQRLLKFHVKNTKTRRIRVNGVRGGLCVTDTTLSYISFSFYN